MSSTVAVINTTVETTTAAAAKEGWQPNVILLSSAGGMLIFVAIVMTVILVIDHFKKKKEKRALEQEQANLDEAFSGPANTPAANIYGVLWGDGVAKKTKTSAEEMPLMDNSDEDKKKTDSKEKSDD